VDGTIQNVRYTSVDWKSEAADELEFIGRVQRVCTDLVNLLYAR